MSRVGLVLHHEREEAAWVTRGVSLWLKERGHDVELPETDARLADLDDRGVPEDRFGQGLDLVVSLGGDGTMLRTVEPRGRPRRAGPRRQLRPTRAT